MYRADRFSRVNHTEQGPVLVTVGVSLVLLVAIACGVRGDKKKGDSSVAVVTPPAVPASTPPTAAGDVMEAGTVAPNAHPTTVKGLLAEGRDLIAQGKPDDAMASVLAAVKMDSMSGEARRTLARVQALRGERDSAEATYRYALTLNTGDSWSMNNLGLLLIEEGRYEDALSPLARAVELRPESPVFANNLGVALERTGHPEEAADSYRASIEADSTYAKATVNLARVDGKMDDSTSKPVDVSELAAGFNQELQVKRQTRLAANMPIKPDSSE
jgi:Flp pilus assembly protein TadD